MVAKITAVAAAVAAAAPAAAAAAAPAAAPVAAPAAAASVSEENFVWTLNTLFNFQILFFNSPPTCLCCC